ncbi:hypothetical protein ACTXT7_001351 [Hymenolepis weldensis]
MEARTTSVVRKTFIQMHFSTSANDSKGYVKYVGETLQHDITQHRDICENIKAVLPHATRITMLLREFNRSEHDLCSSYFQSMDPADITHEKIIIKLGSVAGDNSTLFSFTIREDENVYHNVCIISQFYTSFRFGSLEENQFRYLVFILGLRSSCHAGILLGLLSLLDKKPDVKKSRCRSESAVGSLTASVQPERI